MSDRRLVIRKEEENFFEVSGRYLPVSRDLSERQRELVIYECKRHDMADKILSFGFILALLVFLVIGGSILVSVLVMLHKLAG